MFTGCTAHHLQTQDQGTRRCSFLFSLVTWPSITSCSLRFNRSQCSSTQSILSQIHSAELQAVPQTLHSSSVTTKNKSICDRIPRFTFRIGKFHAYPLSVHQETPGRDTQAILAMEMNLDTPKSEESHVAFDLLNADDPSATSSDGATPRLHKRGLSLSFDGESSSGNKWGLVRTRSGINTSGKGVLQPLLKTIYQELSQLATEADGVSEKVKVRCRVSGCFLSASSHNSFRNGKVWLLYLVFPLIQ